MNFYIIIVNYNGKLYNQSCISSLLNQFCNDTINIIFIDNNSSDGSVEEVLSFFKNKIQIIRLKENTGFAEANNIGIAYAIAQEADYIILINNDTEVQDDFISSVKKCVVKYPNVMIAPLIMNYFTGKVWYGGGQFSKIRGHEINATGKRLCKKERETVFATGCCMIASCNVWKKIYPICNDYFLYFEDTDLCKNIKENNIKIMYCPQIVIKHKVSGSTGGCNSPIFLYYYTRNRLYYKKKWNQNTLLSQLGFTIITGVKYFKWFISGNKKLIFWHKKGIEDFKKGIKGKADYNFGGSIEKNV